MAEWSALRAGPLFTERWPVLVPVVRSIDIALIEAGRKLGRQAFCAILTRMAEQTAKLFCQNVVL